MTSEKQAVVVTGAHGFLGRALVAELRKNPTFRVYGLVRDGGRSLDPSIASLRADITRPSDLERLRLPEASGVLIHAAGLAHRFGPVAAADFRRVNVCGTANVCEWAAERGLRRIVLVSSVAVYGGSERRRPVVEADECRPVGAYAESKYEAERAALELADKENLSLTILRPSTIVGEGDPGNIARLITSINRGRFIWIGDGSNRKSLIYRDDVAAAVRRVVEEAPPAGPELYNLSGPPLLMREIVEAAARGLGRSVPGWRVPAGAALSIRRLNRFFPRSESIERYALLVEKWLSDEVYSARKFSERYGEAAPTAPAEAVFRQAVCYRRSAGQSGEVLA